MHILHYATLSSTNDEARKLAEQHYPSFTIIQAAQQTSGRGRLGRAWQSLEGNLFWSMLYRPPSHIALISSLSHIASVSVFQVITNYCGSDYDGLSMKWPNDILIKGQKLSGILLECSSFKAGASVPEWIIIGVGVNLCQNPASDLHYPATNLKDMQVFDTPSGDRSGYLADHFGLKLGAKMQQNILLWEQHGLSLFLDLIETHLYGRHTPIQITLNDQDLIPKTGILAGITSEGYLKLRTPHTNRIEIITAGDVSYPSA